MKHSALPLFLTAALALGACSTTTLTEEEKAPVQETETSFSGEAKTVDMSKSVISFVGKSNVVNHEGKFNKYEAIVTLDQTEPANLEKARIAAQIDLTDISVDSDGLMGHLQKEDFFDTAANPTATFVSTSITKKSGNMYTITGNLTVKGKTLAQTFDAEITDEYVTAEYQFPREEYGIGNESYGQKLLEDHVPVTIKLVFAN